MLSNSCSLLKYLVRVTSSYYNRVIVPIIVSTQDQSLCSLNYPISVLGNKALIVALHVFFVFMQVNLLRLALKQQEFNAYYYIGDLNARSSLTQGDNGQRTNEPLRHFLRSHRALYNLMRLCELMLDT